MTYPVASRTGTSRELLSNWQIVRIRVGARRYVCDRIGKAVTAVLVVQVLEATCRKCHGICDQAVECLDGYRIVTGQIRLARRCSDYFAGRRLHEIIALRWVHTTGCIQRSRYVDLPARCVEEPGTRLLGQQM